MFETLKADLYPMDEEKLIALVSQYNELYDWNDKRYSDNARRENVWKEIGEKMCSPAQTCKDKWNILRGTYRRKIKSYDTKSGQDGKTFPKWKHENQMSFLQPFVVERRSTKHEIASFPDSDEESRSGQVLPEEDLNPPINTTKYFETAGQDYRETTPSPSPAKKKSKKSRGMGEMSDVFVRYLNHKIEGSKIKSDERTDSLAKFFLSLAETTRTLSPLRQVKVKALCFNAVNAAEMEEILEREKSV